MNSRRLILSSILTFSALFASGAQAADPYPNKPIRIVIGFAAGGPTDLIARALAADISPILGQQVFVENRPGATGLIATEFVARAANDGYTLLIDAQTLITNPLTMAKVNYDPIRDLTPIVRLVSLPLIMLASPNLAANNVQDLVKMAKAKPGDVKYGSAGVAGSGHLAGALLSVSSGTEMTHVPFKGQLPALAEIMAGRIEFIFYAAAGAREQVTAKRVKALAVTTPQRLPTFPDVPTMAEAGFPGFEVTTPWLGLLAPAGTSPDSITKVNEAVRKSLAKPEMIDKFRGLGAVPVEGTVAEFKTYIESDSARWAQLIKTTGIKAE